jgi:hypothetical protein
VTHTPVALLEVTGAIKRALVDITGTHVEDAEAKMRVYLARQ